MDGNHSKSAKAEGSLTATPTGGAGTKVGLSDPAVSYTHLGHSEETARDNLEEGGDDVKSSCPL